MIKIGMLAYTYYLSDPRVRREAEALADRGYSVDVLCLRKSGEASRADVNGVHIIRLPQSRYRGHRAWAYMIGYARFFVISLLWLAWFHIQKSYRIVQVHTMPDFMVFAAVVPRLLGAKIVLDIHDLMPELYGNKFGLAEGHLVIRALQLQERLSARFAHRVIAVHKPQRKLLVGHGIPNEKICTVMNAVDDKIFFRRTKKTEQKPQRQDFTLVYHGTLVRRYGVDVALRAVKQVEKEIPGLRLLIYGGGDELDKLEALAEELHLENTVFFSREFVPLEQIVDLVAQADLGLVPNRDSGKDNFLPTKLLEYVSMDVPAIVSRTDTVETYFDDSMVRFVPPENENRLAEAIRDLYRHPEKARLMVQNAHRFTQRYGWKKQKAVYYQLIDQLLSD